jgi:RNA polymerase sigma-70 factor (ECF subfamily)
LAGERVLRQADSHPETRDEATLVAAARDGEQDAFGELVARHQDKVYSLAFRFTGDAEDATEIAQQAFLKAWRGMRSFRGGASFYTWIFRITVNEARSRGRYRAVRPAMASLDSFGGRAGTPAGRAADPADEAERVERREMVHRALARLEPDQRMMIVLRDMEGRDYAEIAGLLDCPAGTVKSRIHRARMALKELLAPMFGSGEDE